LEDLGDEAYNNLGLGIVKLIVEEEEAAVERAKRLATKATEELADEPTREKVLELVKTILLYKFKNLTPEEVIDMLELDDFKQSRLYQGIKREGKLEVVPLLLELGLSVEEIARRLELSVEQVQQAAQSQSN
jgi:predicted transposase/invertase (TIGR01784 family)